MNNEDDINNPNLSEKIYKDRQIGVGTFIGGPLVAGYFIADNFKKFGETAKVKITWVVSIISTILVFLLAFVLPEKMPSTFLPMIYTIITFSLVRIYQGEVIDSHIKNGGTIQSWWRVIGISTLIMIITLILVLTIAYILMSSEMSKTFGKTSNEITYVQDNITENEVDAIGQALLKTGYFEDEQKSYAYVEKLNNNYEISIGINNANSLNSEVTESYKTLQKDLQKNFPKNKIIIKLVVGDIENVIKRIE